jgi:hypothetical protein
MTYPYVVYIVVAFRCHRVSDPWQAYRNLGSRLHMYESVYDSSNDWWYVFKFQQKQTNIKLAIGSKSYKELYA